MLSIFFSTKVIFFYQNGIFTHFLLILIHIVQCIFNTIWITSTTIKARLYKDKILIYKVYIAKKPRERLFLQKVSQNTQNTRDMIFLQWFYFLIFLTGKEMHTTRVHYIIYYSRKGHPFHSPFYFIRNLITAPINLARWTGDCTASKGKLVESVR